MCKGLLIAAFSMCVLVLPITALAKSSSGTKENTGDPGAIEVDTRELGTVVDESGSCEQCGTCKDRDEPALQFFGPIALVNQQPPNPMFLSPLPADARVLPDGERWARFKLDLTNHLIKDEDAGYIVRFDFESYRFEPELHFGLANGELSVRYMVGYTGRGVLDGMVRGFHQLIQQRSEVRRGGQPYQFQFMIIGPNGVIVEEEPDSWYFGDAVVEYKAPIWDRREGEDALSWRVATKLPLRAVDSGLLDAGGVDYQLGLLYQRQLGRRWRGYLNLDYVFTEAGDWEQVRYNNIPVAVYAVEYAFAPRTTAVLQWRSHRNPISLGSDDTDKDSQELDFAFHRDLGAGTVLTLGIGEDARGMTAPDVTLMAYLKWEL